MKKIKVILVDDDADDRYLFDIFFADRPDLALLPSVCNGAELLDYLADINSPGQYPDLIVLDQNMPRMNGTQTLKVLKAHPKYKEIATVIYSTYTDQNLILEGSLLGAKSVASKPIDKAGYFKMMDQFLKATCLVVPAISE